MLSKVVLAVIGCLAFVSSASAGPIFHLIGSNNATLPHPSGQGFRAASGAWGITTTGGGFMDGRIVFNDSFMLPTMLGQSVSFDETDLQHVSFQHTERAFPGMGAIIPDDLMFSATQADLVYAMGTVSLLGSPGNTFFDLNFIQPATQEPGLLTSIVATHFANNGGGLSGNWTGPWALGFLRDDDAGLFAASLDTMPGTTASPLLQTIINNARGDWRLTGFTQQPQAGIPEPASATLVVLGMAGLAMRRRPRRGEGKREREKEGKRGQDPFWGAGQRVAFVAHGVHVSRDGAHGRAAPPPMDEHFFPARFPRQARQMRVRMAVYPDTLASGPTGGCGFVGRGRGG